MHIVISSLIKQHTEPVILFQNHEIVKLNICMLLLLYPSWKTLEG